MTHKHTQGPWHLGKDGLGNTVVSPEITGALLLNGGCYLANFWGPDAISNAKFFLAAPDMLEALENLRIQLGDLLENELPALLHEGPTSELLLGRLDSYTGKIAEVIAKAKGGQ